MHESYIDDVVETVASQLLEHARFEEYVPLLSARAAREALALSA